MWSLVRKGGKKRTESLIVLRNVYDNDGLPRPNSRRRSRDTLLLLLLTRSQQADCLGSSLPDALAG